MNVNLSPFIGNSSIDHIGLSITREDEPLGFPIMLNFNNWNTIWADKMTNLFMIGYQETVVQKHQSNQKYSKFDVTWSQTKKSLDYFDAVGNLTVEDGWILLRVEPNFKIEHWEEYVAFTYYNWLTGMGGLLSLLVSGFLWTSYWIAMSCGDGISMGILPGLSFNFFSYEELMWMKNRLGKSGVL